MKRKSNNSININEVNNYQITEHKKNPQHMPMEIQVLVWDRQKNVAELNLLTEPIPSLDNLQQQYKYEWTIKKDYGTQICFHSEKTTHYCKNE